MPLLCTRIREGNRPKCKQKKGLWKKFFKKSLLKIWWIKKNTLPLHHFRVNKIAEWSKRSLEKFFEKSLLKIW